MSEQSAEATTDQAAEQGNPDEATLGDAGKKALDRMKAERNEARQAQAALEAQLAEMNRANETAIERATREATEAKAQLEKVPSLVADELRGHLIELHGISEEQAELYLTSSDPAVLRKQAAGIADRTSSPKPDPSQGAKGSDSKASTADQFAAAVEGAFTR